MLTQQTELKVDTTITKPKKLVYLEGIRGLASFMVLLVHYLAGFYPTQASGDLTTAHFATAELWYHSSPLIFLTNGQFFVFIFFVLSGYVLSKRFFADQDMNYLVSAAVRRIPRLYIPVAFSLLVAYTILKLRLNYNIEASAITQSIWLSSQHGNPSIISFLKNLLCSALFFRDNSYNTVLWSISVEIYGSFLIFSALALTRKIRNAFWLYMLLFALFAISLNFEYCSFILGILLNYTDKIKITKNFQRQLIAISIIVFGLFLGGFPQINYKTTATVKGTFYAFANYSLLLKFFPLINAIGAFLVIFSAQLSGKIKKIFSVPLFAFLGNISFSLYLLHAIVLQSLSSFIFLKCYKSFGYNESFLISFFISTAIILAASYFMTLYVDKYSVVASEKIYRTFFKRKESSQAV